MTLPDPELRTLAWRQFDCGYCDEKAGRRCVSATGKRQPPHLHRITQAQTWLSRQPEVDALTARLQDLGATVEQTDLALARMTTERDDLRVTLQRANLEVTGLVEANGRLSLDLAATKTALAARDVTIAGLRARIAELEKPTEPTPTRMLVGAAVGGNSDPGALEAALGKPLDLRRTYYGADGVAKAITTCKADHAKGRLPFISFKLPHGWADMAAGKGDAWVRDLGTKLAALDAPVWVAFHHEPEGDGNIADWRAMQARILPLAASAKVKVGIALTGYSEVTGGSPSFADTWPGPMAQFLAVDLYQRYGTTDAGLKWTPLDSHYAKVAAFAKSKGVPWGTAETGVTDEAFAKDPQSMAALFKAHRDNGAAFLCYFDSFLNSKGFWPLTDGATYKALPAKLAAFAQHA